MPDNKKHHYVPQFYLRFFSENGRSVNLFNLKRGKAIAQASLKGQCFRDYMYGKDQTLEHGLSRLEGAFVQLLRSSFASRRLPPPHSPDHESLLIALQYARSAYTADALDEMADGIWKRILRLRPDVDPTLLEKVKIVHTEPARLRNL